MRSATDAGWILQDIRTVVQISRKAAKARDSHKAETGLYARKPLFRALLSQLHPGRSGTPRGAGNTGGDLSSRRSNPRGKGLENA